MAHSDTQATVIAGVHLSALLDLHGNARATEVLGSERGWLAADWHRQHVGHGRYPLDPRDGRPTSNPYVCDLLAIPVELVAPLLAERGVAVPTRADCAAWLAADQAEGGDAVDAELELWRAANVADPDLTPSSPAEPRVCGVPMSVYDALERHDQERVRDGLVIAPPRAPLFVARWLAMLCALAPAFPPIDREHGDHRMTTRTPATPQDRAATLAHECGHALAAVVLGGSRMIRAEVPLRPDAHGRTGWCVFSEAVPEHRRAEIAYAGPWCESRWRARRTPRLADVHAVLAAAGCRDHASLIASGDPLPRHIEPTLERLWPAVFSLAQVMNHRPVGRSDVLHALGGLTEETAALAFANIRAGGVAGSFRVAPVTL